jgi:hypothetical protein
VSGFFTPPEDDKWERRAACRAEGVDPEWFFPAQENGPSLSKARSICERCPVKEECFLKAMASEGGKPIKSRFGVYAGLTGGQRHGLYVRARDRAKRTAAA